MVMHKQLAGQQPKGTMVEHKQSVDWAAAQVCHGDSYKQLAGQQPKCTMVIGVAAAQVYYGRA